MDYIVDVTTATLSRRRSLLPIKISTFLANVIYGDPHALCCHLIHPCGQCILQVTVGYITRPLHLQLLLIFEAPGICRSLVYENCGLGWCGRKLEGTHAASSCLQEKW